MPSISDADVVIIDLNTMTAPVMESLREKTEDLRCELRDKFLSRGTLVFILGNDKKTNPDEEYWYIGINPMYVHSTPINTGTKINYNEDHPFAGYLNHVKQFDYYIDEVRPTPELEERMESFIDHLSSYNKQNITDNSNRILGGTYVITGKNRQVISGNIVLLPPTKPPSEAISRIIAHFKKNDPETPPPWTDSINIAKLENIKNKISQLKKEKQNIENAIEIQTNEKQQLSQYLGLLYAQGRQLEKIVKDTFILLGFEEMRKERNFNDEDWLINLNSIDSVKFGVLEVKGRRAKTSLQDIAQCNKWVEDYLRMTPSTHTKGIFIPNQFRLFSFPKSKNQRKRFEPNELEYAQTRNICIIPTYVLFEAVNNILDGQQPDRNKIEELIYKTNGVLESVL